METILDLYDELHGIAPVVEKKKRGRPRVEKQKKDDPFYFGKYYAEHSKYKICECGQQLKSTHHARHKKSKIHSVLMEQKGQNNS